jgi:murein DD-endopeptidase MepM/ murein hydrolase activator NlpD
MIKSARTGIMALALAAGMSGTVATAQAAWIDWFSGDRTVLRGDQRPEAGQPGQRQLVAVVQAGDTLMRLLARYGVNSVEAARAFEAMQDFADPSRLQVGDNVLLTLSESEGLVRLFALHVDFQADLSLTLVRGSDGAFHAAAMSGRPSLVVETVSGHVTKSFRSAMVDAGVPGMLLDDVIRALDYDPSLPKRIKPGTQFQVIYERLSSGPGRRPSDRLRLRYAEVTIDRSTHRFYHYSPPAAEPKLASVPPPPAAEPKLANVPPPTVAAPPARRSEGPPRFIVPIEDGKVNSGFGMRRHPVLRKMRMHRGVDFPAAKGTPILAAADGVVEDMGWRGNYGNYIRISHDSRHATAYGHLDGFAPEISEGERVTQGQVIGYVGRTGLSTGNHLYWEVLVDNKYVDPSKVRMLQGESVSLLPGVKPFPSAKAFAAKKQKQHKLAKKSPVKSVAIRR